jgi:Fe-S cluster assembly protein SufD
MKEPVEIKTTTASTSWLSEAFEKKPQASANCASLEDYRQEQFAQFKQRGLPTRREEAWKYADLSFLEKEKFNWPPLREAKPLQSSLKKLLAKRAEANLLLVFVNGHFSPELSALSDLPEGVILCTLQEALQTRASLLTPYLLREYAADRHPLVCLNAALFSDGLFIYLPPGTILEKPLHLLSLSMGGTQFMTHTRHVLVMESDTQASVTEEYLSEEADHYFTNSAMDLFVGRNALLNYYKVQNEASQVKHFANLFIHQKQNSSVNACSFVSGGQFSRNEVWVTLQEQHAACRLNGFYGLDVDGQVIDNHIFIDHAAQSTQSAMDYRGIIAKQARAVFNGKVHVRKEAKKTEAQQVNHNILLSPLAEIDTKPELEIYADDVQCRHGATVGQLDEEALFYLGTRGMDRETATRLLLQAFVEAVLSEVTLPWLIEAMHEQWGRHLLSL